MSGIEDPKAQMAKAWANMLNAPAPVVPEPVKLVEVAPIPEPVAAAPVVEVAPVEPAPQLPEPILISVRPDLTEKVDPLAEARAGLTAYQARTQTFFADLQRAMNAPAYGHHAKALYGQLLILAQEKGLYTP